MFYEDSRKHGLRHNPFKALIAPRLLELNRAMPDPSVPGYKANRKWIKRISTPHEVGAVQK